ncbi:ferredoxin--nitrite reductase [Candidatus Nitrosotenuis cloacae]|uniref:Ferredoxin--nitrite reductase n=2 Tax=Candidatus Nitrosotenuis cloacae TaxID=1603555 RepID=A0A3G1B0W5_9ARCH|nr:ferredoxin--nitrite reductase [Candidatus Nitrosotenuis cloacae]
MNLSTTIHKPKEGRKPKVNWARIEEADHFANTVKQFRQGKLDADLFRRFRLQHGAYGTRMTDDYAMVRVKLPAGEVYPHQLERLATLSEQYSIGSAHVSTRQNVQLHWVILEDVSEIMRNLAEVGLTSREACGNAVRNVMCSPLAGVCNAEEFDVTPYAIATAKFFLRNPLNQSLPRKFKFNFTCCEKHGMARMVDVGLIPQIKIINGKEQRGFKVFLGGGLGNKSFVGHQLEDWTPEEDLLYTSIATIRIFDRLGDRKNMARNRMRYLVDEMGWEKFQNLVLKERALVRMTQSAIVKLSIDQNPQKIEPHVRISGFDGKSIPDGFSRWRKGNTFAQKQAGYYSVSITLEAGDVTASQLRAIADISREFSAEGYARTGFVQDIYLRWVAESDLPRLYSKLLEIGLANPGSLTMVHPIGCSGTTSCNLALTNSHRLAKEIQRKFIELKLDEDEDLREASIKISGCPNSCGQHEIATLGFFGGGGRAGKDMYPIYQMSLGGRSDGDTMLGLTLLRIPAKRVIPATLKLIEIFKANKKQGDDFKSWIHKVVTGHADSAVKSLDDIKKILLPFTEAPSIEADKDFYADYGSDSHYHARTGKGECAA